MFWGAVELETAVVNREKCAAHLFKGHCVKSGAGTAKQNACPLPRSCRVTSTNRFEKHLPKEFFFKKKKITLPPLSLHLRHKTARRRKSSGGRETWDAITLEPMMDDGPVLRLSLIELVRYRLDELFIIFFLSFFLFLLYEDEEVLI